MWSCETFFLWKVDTKACFRGFWKIPNNNRCSRCCICVTKNGSQWDCGHIRLTKLRDSFGSILKFPLMFNQSLQSSFRAFIRLSATTRVVRDLQTATDSKDPSILQNAFSWHHRSIRHSRPQSSPGMLQSLDITAAFDILDHSRLLECCK